LIADKTECLSFSFPHGTIHISSDGLSAVVNCNVGYIISGNKEFICENGMFWSGSATCGMTYKIGMTYRISRKLC